MYNAAEALSSAVPEGAVNHPHDFPLRLRLFRRFGRQTSLMPRGRDTILRILCNPDKCKPYPFEVDFFGYRYRGNMACNIDWNVFMYGSYAHPELRLLSTLAALVRKQRNVVNFFDVGANVGNHTLFMAAHADKIFAFEPFAPVRELLQSKVASNRLNNVTIFPVALGATDEKLAYSPGAGRNTGMGTLIPRPGTGFAAPVDVAVRNGDRLIDEHGLPRIDLLKIDVEGFEPFVLRGLSQHILSDRPFILTELSDKSRRNLDSESAFRSLFYDGALLAEVRGRQACTFELHDFRYERSNEVLVVPPEHVDFLSANQAHR